MTDAIKRLRDAALEMWHYHYVTGAGLRSGGTQSDKGQAVWLDSAERILTDAVAAERARVREAALLRCDGMHHEYPQYGQVTAWALIERMREAITEVCGGTHD